MARTQPRKKKSRSESPTTRHSIIVGGRMVVRSPYTHQGYWIGGIRDRLTSKVHKCSTYLKATQRNLPRARQILQQIAESLIDEASYDTYPAAGFEDAFREWLDLKDVRPSTLKEYKTDFKGVYLPTFKHQDVHDITRKHVESFLADLLKNHRSARTRRRHLSQLRSFFSWAQTHDYCLENPCEGLKVSKGEKVHHGQSISVAQAKSLLKACQTPTLLKLRDGRRPKGWKQKAPAPPYLYLSVLIALYTGLRRANITNLTWSQVDLKSRKITVPAGEMKGKRPHEVPIHKDLAGILKSILKAQSRLRPNALVIGKPVRQVRKSFHSALTRAKLPKMRWHDLRHTFATWMSTRCSFAALQQLLGHSPGTVTLQYTHVPFEELRKSVDSLPTLLSSSHRKTESSSTS